MSYEFDPEVRFGLKVQQERKEVQRQLDYLHLGTTAKADTELPENVLVQIKDSLRHPRAQANDILVVALHETHELIGGKQGSFRLEVDRRAFPDAPIPWVKDFPRANPEGLPRGVPWPVIDALWGAKDDESTRVIDIDVDKDGLSVSTAIAGVRVVLNPGSPQKFPTSMFIPESHPFPNDNSTLYREAERYLTGKHYPHLGGLDELGRIGLDFKNAGSLIGFTNTALRNTDLKPKETGHAVVGRIR